MPSYNSGLALTHVTSSIPYCTQIVATKLSVAIRRNPLQSVAMKLPERSMPLLLRYSAAQHSFQHQGGSPVSFGLFAASFYKYSCYR